jgi:hypothetical protein
MLQAVLQLRRADGLQDVQGDLLRRGRDTRACRGVDTIHFHRCCAPMLGRARDQALRRGWVGGRWK